MDEKSAEANYILSFLSNHFNSAEQKAAILEAAILEAAAFHLINPADFRNKQN